jgi:lysophospholipase L1-like esterase
MKKRMCLFSILLFVFFLEIIIASPVSAIIRIMPLGDSITQGFSSGVSDPDYMVSYRKALWDLLVADGYDVDFVGSLNNGSAVFGNLDLADHEGYPGERADQIRDNIYNWLVANPADIILLHVGTNDILTSQDPALIAAEVSQILDEIDRYELDYGVDIPVILALIINRWNYICGNASTTTTFNNDVYDMALSRINSGDIIEIVDMECGANIDYREQPVGDMWDALHPFETGYEKMADVWFSGIFEITHPVADAGPDQSVEGGDTVTIDASNSVDPDGVIDSYFWEQMPGGSPVVLSDPEVVKPTFIAPNVGSGGEALTFKVTVTDADGLESTDTTNVEVSYGVGTLAGGSSGVVVDSGGGGGCFIATAAYGSLMEPHVKILREFRDNFMLGNTAGRVFVRLYYMYSPPIADFIAKDDDLKAFVRVCLLPVVGMSWVSLKLGILPTISLMLLFGIGCIGFTRVRRKCHIKRDEKT